MGARNLFLLFGSLTLCIFLVMPGGAQEANKIYPPPGKLVDVGGWRLHLNCTGQSKGKTPTIVLESGAGDFSFDWTLAQTEVARFARVCSYDRAGRAWSDLGPRPRTMRQVAYELRTALLKAGEKGPYVLVGQSIGGLLIRTYASQYPKEVSGMVLVDSTHEDTQLNVKGKIQRMRELSQGRTIPPVQTTIRAAEKELSAEEKQQVEDTLKQIGSPKIGPPFNRLPAEIQAMRLWGLAQPHHYVADSDPYWSEEFAEIYAARKKQEYPLGDAPLIVLTRGKRGYPNNEVGDQLEAERKRMQADLLNLSRNSKQIIAANSGHHIQLDEPEVVTNAIRQVIDAVQRRAKLLP
jgi:pimeloyl-ACP methyl ester carboxylesterase